MTLDRSTIITLQNIFSTEQAAVVGGAVRDALLDRPITDLDIVIPGNTVSWASLIAEKCNGRAFILDAARGISRISLGDRGQIDMAQQQGKTLEDDLSRRDFSINAMAVPMNRWMKPNWKASLMDIFGGQRDIQKKLIRQISKTAITSDPLRLMRAFRIGAEMGYKIEKTTLTTITTQRKKIKQSAPERIREEFLKLFSVPMCSPWVEEMDRCRLLSVLIPEIEKLRRCAPRYYGKDGVMKHTLDSLKHLEDIFLYLKSWFPKSHAKVRSYLNETQSGYPRYAHLKWGVLLHDLGKPDTAKIHKGRLRFFEHEHVGADKIPPLTSVFRWSVEETKTYAQLVRNHMRPGNLASQPALTDKAINRFFRDLNENAIGMLLVSLGDHLSYLTPRQLKKRNSAHERLTQKMVQTYYSQKDSILPPKIISGNDIMKIFRLKPSPLIGQLLSAVEDGQVEGKIKIKEDAVNFCRQYLKENQNEINEQKN